jgi:DNA-binding response OmpR family regulator
MQQVNQIDNSARVLLVEDEAFIATDLEEMLSSFGFTEITICLTYSDAAEQVKLNDHGLAIFDINVGGMLSYGLISNAVSNGSAVVTISGYITESETMDGRVFLANDLLAAISQAQGMCGSTNAA